MLKVQQKVNLYRDDGFFNCMSLPVYQIERGMEGCSGIQIIHRTTQQWK